MRVSSKSFFKKKKVIEIQKSFASIIDVNEAEGYVYNIQYLADIPQSIKNKVALVKISVYPDNPLVKSSMFGNSVTAEESIRNVRNYSSRIKDRLKEARSDLIVFKNSDITSSINNEVAKRIFANPQHASMLLGNRRSYVAVPSKGASASGKDVILSTPKGDNISNTSDVKASALRAILRDSIDPSSVAEATFPISTHESAMQGISRYGKGNRRYYPNRAPNSAVRKLDNNMRELQHSHSNRLHKLSQSAMNIRNHLRKTNIPSGKSKISYKVISKFIKNTFVNITEEIVFPKPSIENKNDIHFLFELYNADNAIIDVIHRTVNHNELLEDYLTPDYPPMLYAKAQSPGKNMVRVFQVDRIATSIRLYRKRIAPSSPMPMGRYQLIDTIPLKRSDGSIRIIDRVGNTKDCIYMAIAVGPTRKMSSRHRRKVCRRYMLPTGDKKINEELTHASIFAENTQDHVSLRITNIPVGPVSLYVTATDMSSVSMHRSGNRKSRVVGSLPNEQVILINKSMLETGLLDYDVKDGHIYEYKCILIYPSGKTVESKVSEIHEFKKENVSTERATIEISELNVLADDVNNITITFDIAGVLTSPGINMVIDSLQAAGIDSSFVDEILSGKSDLSSILSYCVLRQDDTSGQTEDMGVFLGGTFVDSPATRESLGVTDIIPGRTYRYIIKVLLQSPQTLFVGSRAIAIDSETNQAFSKLVSKYYNPYTLETGTLPSTAAASGYNVPSRISSSNKFLQGSIGLEKSIDAVIPSQICSISSASCTKLANGKNLISWSISGSQDEIDHFLVMASYQGIKSTIATAHNMSESGIYKMIDLELSGEVGEVLYSIIPVYSNYTYGTEVSAESVIVKNSEPIFEVTT
jgi:hypothetical protein